MTKIEEPLLVEIVDIMDIPEFENEAGVVIDSVTFTTLEVCLHIPLVITMRVLL
jgi:hypothetical protein